MGYLGASDANLLGSAVKFQVYSVVPPEAKLYTEIYTDQAVAIELYGDATVPVVRDPDDASIVSINSRSLKDEWNQYFMVPVVSAPLAAAVDEIGNADPNRVALAYLTLMARKQPNSGYFFSAAEKQLALVFNRLTEPLLKTLCSVLVNGAIRVFPPRPPDMPLRRMLSDWKARGPTYKGWSDQQNGRPRVVTLPYDGPSLIATPGTAVPYYGDRAPADPRVLVLQKMIAAGPIGAAAGTLALVRGCDTNTVLQALNAAESLDGMATTAAAIGAAKAANQAISAPAGRAATVLVDEPPNAAAASMTGRLESKGAARPRLSPRRTFEDPFTGVTSDISATATKDVAINKSIRADVAEGSAYNATLARGEVGLQQAYGSNTGGPDFITAERLANGRWRVIVYDAKSRTSATSRFEKATMKGPWMAEVRDSVRAGRLDLGDPVKEAAIRDAVTKGEVYFNQVNVDYSPAGQGKMSFGTPSKI